MKFIATIISVVLMGLIAAVQAHAVKIETLAYTGNAVVGRVIPFVTINASSGASVYVRIVNNATANGVQKFGWEGGMTSYPIGTAVSPSTVAVTGVTGGGMTLSSSSLCNENGLLYSALIIEDDGQADVQFMTHRGNSTDNTWIPTPQLSGVTSDYVLVRADGIAANAYIKNDWLGDTTDSSGSDNEFQPRTDRVQRFNTEGFQVGTNSAVNATGTTYYSVSLVKNSIFTTATWVGNESGSSLIATNGVSPSWAEVSGNTTQVIWCKDGRMGGTNAYSYRQLAVATNVILSLESNGFTVGGYPGTADNGYLASNGRNTTYYGLAFQDGTSGGGAPPATSTAPKGQRVMIQITNWLKRWLTPAAWAGRE